MMNSQYDENIKNLKRYIKDDEIYQEYNNNPAQYFSDFDKFCIEHCEDIKRTIEYTEYLEKELTRQVKIILEVREECLKYKDDDKRFNNILKKLEGRKL